MKVLLLPSSYFPVSGGLQTVARALAQSLKARGNDVSVITNKFPRQLAAHENIDGISTTRWHFLIPRLEQLLSLRLDLFLAGVVLFPLTLVRLVSRLSRERPDVVNVHFVGAAGFFVLLARFFATFRLVVSLHGHDVEGLSRGKRFDCWIFRALLRRADAVTACSDYLLQRIAEIEPCVQTKGRVVYNGIDEQPTVSAPACAGSIVAVGRLVPQKGFDVLLRAFVGSKHHARLTLIGDGPDRENLMTLARSLGLNGEISFTGVIERAETLAAMKSANVIAVPSLQESFGMVALEGMALGKPIVASRVGGLPEVLENADAWLVEPGNPIELAAAIEAALDKTRTDPQFGQRNRGRAAGFSTERMVNEYLAAYELP